jgi:2-C-methyl-D-erythritol 4-phosphate cytidylyltransferase/2-C-methyl-D-erythritol 2,4-cyclodiphosphate synthase
VDRSGDSSTLQGPVGAVIVAAGSSTRLSGPVPKPLLLLDGRTILERTLEAFERSPHIDQVAVAVGAPHVGAVRALLGGKVRAVVPGGELRRASVAAGLEVLSAVDWIVVHDGVRPFVSEALIERVLNAAQRWGAASAALPVTDTLKDVREDRVRRTVDRAGLFAVQTPQAFRAGLLRDAHRRVPMTETVTDDAELVERLGEPVAVVPGDPANIKITTPADLDLARRYAAAARGSDGVGGTIRIGVGYDIHPLTPDRALVLGGVTIPHPRGLAGHSDADVLVHAVMDAVLGAAGQPDIGHQFPPDDPAYRNADSLALLKSVADRLRTEGWFVVNVDAVILAEAPRLSPFVEAMRARLAGALRIQAGAVGVKATTMEGLGPVGRGEGIAAQAVALLRKVE